MRKRIIRYFSKTKYRQEFRRELRLLIVVTLAFTIGFTWRETIFDLSLAFVHWLTHAEQVPALSVLASIFITLMSVGLIYLTSYLLKEKPEDNHY